MTTENLNNTSWKTSRIKWELFYKTFPVISQSNGIDHVGRARTLLPPGPLCVYDAERGPHAAALRSLHTSIIANRIYKRLNIYYIQCTYKVDLR